LVGERIVEMDFHKADVGSQKLEVRDSPCSSFSMRSEVLGPKRNDDCI
jgi:hypothetical protein